MKENINNRRIFSFFGKTLMTFVAALTALCITSQTADAAATEYYIWIGGTQVTSDNAGNILNETNPENGEPTASFDEATLTLTLNGVHITPDYYSVIKERFWNDPEGNSTHGSNYQAASMGSQPTVYSMFFGPLVGRRFTSNANSGAGSRGTIVLKGENVIDGYGVGILAGKQYLAGGAEALTTYLATFSIIGDGTLRINQIYSEKDGYPAPAGALNLLEMPGETVFGEKGGKGPKIYLNGIRSGLYSPHNTLFNYGGTANNLLNEHIAFCLYGDTFISAQGGLIGFDTRYSSYGGIYSDNKLYLEDNAILAAKSTGNFSDPDPEIKNKAFFEFTPKPTSGSVPIPYIYYDESEYAMILGTSKADVGNWVVYGPYATDPVALARNLYSPITNADPDSDSYTDPDIDVWGHTKDGIVYSVDVEWGAMTFQYETSSWDSETHTTKEGRGWLVYDTEKEKALTSKQDLINQVTVTNHSNAEVYATLSYAGEDGYTETTGSFTTKEDDSETIFTEASETGEEAAEKTIPAYLTLGTADNDEGELEGQGKATVGNVYFLPEGIAKTDDKVNDITKWTQIGTITVGLVTEEPTE